MSNAEVALKAAKDLNADSLVPDIYRSAIDNYYKAKRDYRLKSFDTARKFALRATRLAEQAEFEAYRMGGATPEAASKLVAPEGSTADPDATFRDAATPIDVPKDAPPDKPAAVNPNDQEKGMDYNVYMEQQQAEQEAAEKARQEKEKEKDKDKDKDKKPSGQAGPVAPLTGTLYSPSSGAVIPSTGTLPTNTPANIPSTTTLESPSTGNAPSTGTLPTNTPANIPSTAVIPSLNEPASPTPLASPQVPATASFPDGLAPNVGAPPINTNNAPGLVNSPQNTQTDLTPMQGSDLPWVDLDPAVNPGPRVENMDSQRVDAIGEDQGKSKGIPSLDNQDVPVKEGLDTLEAQPIKSMGESQSGFSNLTPDEKR